MAQIIKHRAVIQDSWQLLEAGAGGVLPSIPASGDVIVPLAVFFAFQRYFVQGLLAGSVK